MLEGGTFMMGSDDDRFPGDGEGPIRKVTVSPFALCAQLLTNREFATFVEATGYVTAAERDGWSFVFGGLLPDDFEATRAAVGAEWWRVVHGAQWRHPFGPHSNLDGLVDHPVVHLSWRDAQEVASFYGARLPTEAEWEFAARGGLVDAIYAWGDELESDGVHRCNIWQGSFPDDNTMGDGWYGTSPVGSYAPNSFGLYDTAGNVWEWCADWFDAVFHRSEDPLDPVGPPEGTSRVIRGGSYLCHDSYCNRYRVAARTSNTPESTTGNISVRLAR